jgi:triacylglycerol lipase
MRRILGGLAALAAAAGLVGQIPAAHAAERDPVVFVHGYSGSAANWKTAKTVFEQAGYQSDRLFAYEYNSYGDNKTNAQGLAKYIEDVKAKTGAAKVDIVNHSMGGLVSLWYLKVLNGNPNVDHLASIAGANHGTQSAVWCSFFTTCRQMTPGSAFIKQLTTGDETPGDTKYATWYSPADGVINPYKSTKLDGATNNEIPNQTHMGFLKDTSVLTSIAAFLGS